MSQSLQTYLMVKCGILGNKRGTDRTWRFAEVRAFAVGTASMLGPITIDNVQVDDPLLDQRHRTQSETSSAVSGSNIVIELRCYRQQRIEPQFSNDDGHSFTQVSPPLYPSTGEPRETETGRGCWAERGLLLRANRHHRQRPPLDDGVTLSEDGGATWGPLVNATSSITSSTESTTRVARGRQHAEPVPWQRLSELDPFPDNAVRGARLRPLDRRRPHVVAVQTDRHASECQRFCLRQ